jgi:hypothetical protein
MAYPPDDERESSLLSLVLEVADLLDSGRLARYVMNRCTDSLIAYRHGLDLHIDTSAAEELLERSPVAEPSTPPPARPAPPADDHRALEAIMRWLGST